MKRLIKVQSASDVITNSSSEIFIVSSNSTDRQKLAEDIREMLEVICKAVGYGDLEDTLIVEVFNESFGNKGWRGYTANKGDILIRSTKDNSIPGFIMDFLEYDLQYCPAMLSNKIINVDRYHLG